MEINSYTKDFLAAKAKEADFIKNQVMLELICAVCSCDNFEEFKNVMFSKALDMVHAMSADGTISKATADAILNPLVEVQKAKEKNK